MKTFNLIEAADFLKMNPETVRRLAVAKQIPGAKPGKCWCFLEEDLAEYLRSLYSSPCKVSQGVLTERRTIWHSAKEITSGGFDLLTKEREYRKALGLLTK